MRVFATRSKEEEDLAEATLRHSGVAFEIRLDAVDDTGNVCHLATVYDVKDGDAERARRLLREAGLAHGVIV